jgi:hypothetical protein
MHRKLLIRKKIRPEEISGLAVSFVIGTFARFFVLAEAA